MNKKFAAIGTIALLTTSSGAAFAQMTEISSSTTEQVITQVTKPTPIINSQVTKEVIISGPVKAVSLEAGPVLTSDPPLLGSVDWMAQEKAAKEKIKTDAQKVQDELEAEIVRLEKIASDTKKLNETLILVKKQIGKTPWVFSGSTPSAWDCSGMVRWTYAHLGVDLEHSASKQRLSGEFVDKPKIGDLVSFNHRSYGSAYHIGIYVGPDEMIHAGGKPGDRTEIRSIKGWAKDNGNSQITYTRIIETNN
jgi:cell wall-associated NlpC family hydrolase